MSKGLHYTAKDIERYHNGGMTAAEMHQLEKAALDDPMLADALEGYRFSNAPTVELATLQSRLQERIASEKKKSRIVWLQPWMRIAALIVLVAGAGWLVVQTFSTNENNLVTSAPSLNKEERQVEVTADSTATVLEQSPAAFSTDSNTRDLAAHNIETQRRTSQSPQAVTTAPVTAMQDAAAEESLTSNRSKEEAQTLASPQNEMATLRSASPPTVLQQQMDSTASDQLAKRNEAKMEEVVVVRGYGAARAKARISADSLGQPQIGWPAFEEYVAKNRKPFLPLAKKGVSESSVALSFTIDPQGNPVNIVVTQSINKQMDEEAIRLLKEGPRWKGRAGRVKILFPN